MGAWGHSLFENDWDFDIVSEMDHEVGLKHLEKEMQAKAKEQDVSLNDIDTPMEPSEPKSDNASEVSNDHGVYLTMHEGGSHPLVVRDFLDSNGALTGLITKYALQSATGQRGDDIFNPSYQLVIIGASAMSVGCQLSDDFKYTLKKIYGKIGLGAQAQQQMKKALYGPDGFRDGFPYNFGSLSLLETANATPDLPSSNTMGYQLMNVFSGPGTLWYKGVDKDTGKTVKECMGIVEKEFPENVCGACGAAQGKNGALLMCGRCNKRRYCGKECQKSHWRAHKKVCVSPAAMSKESE